MPNFPIPAEFGTEEDIRKRFTEEDLFNEFTRDENGDEVMTPEEAQKKIEKLGGYDKIYRIKFEADYLAKLTYDGAAERYGDPLPKEVDDRIRFELHVMKTMGFSGYLLIAQDFINAARNELGVIVGPGRGSAAGSVVVYCLGITQIDPIKYDLLFERFLTPDSISMPDIDIDFDDDGKDKVQKWVREKYGADNVARIKMNFLGLRTLSIIKDTLNKVKQIKGVILDINHIPLDDPETFKLYQEGRTIGTFQFESVSMRKYLKQLKPTVFEDLIAMNALYRPGSMDYILDFIKRKNDPSLITYDIPCMEKYLKETYGITVYQEQVMLLSQQLAGFTRSESDILRKAMSKRRKDIVDAMKPKFIEGGKERGYDPMILDKIWGDWEKFASYAFIKSHAVCYSFLAYLTAYLKAHYPTEFMAANMSHNMGDSIEIKKLMKECKSMGIMGRHKKI